MKSYIVLPAVAATAWAQQAESGEAEKALRGQVEKYYQLMMDKKFREAEKLVAEESREDYYNGKKPDIRGFTILSTRLADDSHAVVTIKAKQLVLMMGAGAQIFEIASPTNWKLEEGEWKWYIPEQMKNRTPFGKVSTTDMHAGGIDLKGKAPGSLESPDFGALQGQVSADKTSIVLTTGSREQIVTLTNHLPGPADLRLDPHVNMIRGITVELDKARLNEGEKAQLKIRRIGEEPVADVIVVTAQPLNVTIRIQVRTQ